MVSQNRCITFTLSSEVRLVDLISHLLSDLLAYERADSPPGLIMVTRELLRNAVSHGNKGDPDCLVECRLDGSDPSWISVTVSDEGVGFDHELYRCRGPRDPRHAVGRGYALISSCSDRIEFARNGATVTVYVRRPRA
jgi:anti-sigma regulatory factor (Ser/Thr protein kinase)